MHEESAKNPSEVDNYFEHPNELLRQVNLYCSGMSVHNANQHVHILMALWEQATVFGWTVATIKHYLETQAKLRLILANEKKFRTLSAS